MRHECKTALKRGALMSWEYFRIGYFIGLGVLGAAATGLILWGLYDVLGGIVDSIKLAWHWRKSKKEPSG